MGLVSTKYMLQRAKERKYAIPAFNIHNLETINTVIKGASEEKSPVIIAATPGTVAFAGAENLVSILKTVAKKATIPVAYHLDHHQRLENIFKSIDLGCKSVMIDASDLPYEENVKKVKAVVEYAHHHDVTVEAELGRLVGIEGSIEVSDQEGFLTDPILAQNFVEETGIDSLAIAIGTAHGLYKKEPILDLDRLKAIEALIEVPLVLHGASGLSQGDVEACIKRGISKVNIATELKIPFGQAMRMYMNENPEANDLRKIMVPAKDAMLKVVKEKIKICRSNNQGVISYDGQTSVR